MSYTAQPGTPPNAHGQASSNNNPSRRVETVLMFLIILLSWLLGSLGPVLTGGFSGTPLDKFAQSLGAGLGVLLISAVPAFLIKLGARWVWIPFSTKRFLSVLACCVILGGTISTAGHLYNWRRSTPADRADRLSIALSPQSYPISPSPGQEEIKGNLYRNVTYHFRIRFPEGWRIKDGDGKHIVKKAEAENLASISVLVRTGPNDANSNEFSEDDLFGFGDLIIQPMLKRLEGKLLAKRIVYVNNQKTLYLKSQVMYRRLSGDHRAVNEQYVMLKHGLLYLLTASVRESEFSRLSGTVNESIDSFVIEDWQ